MRKNIGAGRGSGQLLEVGERWRLIWEEYEFIYKYRDGKEICEEWSEDWSEKCRLK